MKILRNILLIILFTVLLVNCKKDNSVLGVDAQPLSDALGTIYSDTSIIYAHTISGGRIASFNDRYKFLGSTHDQHFGRTDVGLYTNLNLPNSITNVAFGDDANLVSAEIILMVADINFSGNSTVPLTYSVFPVINNIDKTIAYYSSNDSLHDKNTVLGSYTGTYSVLNDKLVLRIPVDYNFAKAVLNNPQYLIDNSTFQNTYKGFYISSSASNLNPLNAQGVLSKFDLEDALSGFYLYYQNGTPSATKQNKTFQFTFSGGDAARYNTVKYKPENDLLPTSSLYKQIINKDSTAGKDNLYLKGLGGTKVKFFIPGLDNYADSFPVSINRAELIFNLDASFLTPNGQYIPPPKLAILPIGADDSSELFALDQLNVTDLERYNGNYDYTTNKYTFNIARHVQAILRGVQKNHGFYLVVADPSPVYTSRRDNYMERIILAGGNHATLKPKFNISYVKFRNDKK